MGAKYPTQQTATQRFLQFNLKCRLSCIVCRGYGRVSSRNSDDGLCEGSSDLDVEDQQGLCMEAIDGGPQDGRRHRQPRSESADTGHASPAAALLHKGLEQVHSYRSSSLASTGHPLSP